MNGLSSLARTVLACWALGLAAAETEPAPACRTWTDRKGASLEAALVKEENGSVFLKRKDGSVVQARLDNLCDEDRVYVRDLTYVPRDRVAVFRKHHYKDMYDEPVGAAEPANVRDTVVLRTVEGAAEAAQAQADTRWKVESVDRLGKRLRPRGEGEGGELTTDGVFVFVTYTVANDTPLPLTVTHPLLHDHQGRKYLQFEHAAAAAYIPDGALFAGVAMIPPGFKKLFCSFYEVPEDARPVAVEVFPSKTSPFFVRSFSVAGKVIHLDAAPDAAAEPDAPDVAAASAAGNVLVFLKCVRVGQGGDSSFSWSYDRFRGRSLTYGLELRTNSQQPTPVLVRAYFIAAANNLDLVVGSKEERLVLEPGKIGRLAVQSETVDERSYYYFNGRSLYGVKPKGVIVQVWVGNAIAASFCSMNHWKRIAESPDVMKQMGELKATP